MGATLRFDTPMGPMRAEVGSAGEVARLEFVGDPGAADAPAEVAPIARQLAEYFAGERRTFELALDPAGTDFELAVWEALLQVPWGQTVSYGTLAERIGRTGSARAVGGAVGANPIAIVIPCHRALGAGGALTGYAGGIERKRALLELEGSLSMGLDV